MHIDTHSPLSTGEHGITLKMSKHIHITNCWDKYCFIEAPNSTEVLITEIMKVEQET